MTRYPISHQTFIEPLRASGNSGFVSIDPLKISATRLKMHRTWQEIRPTPSDPSISGQLPPIRPTQMDEINMGFAP